MRRALVTAGARRLGRAMVLYLARRGFDVAIHYATSQDAAQETAAKARSVGVRAVALKADLLDHDETLALVPRAAEALGGPLDLLINNASIFDHDRLETFDGVQEIDAGAVAVEAVLVVHRCSLMVTGSSLSRRSRDSRALAQRTARR